MQPVNLSLLLPVSIMYFLPQKNLLMKKFLLLTLTLTILLAIIFVLTRDFLSLRRLDDHPLYVMHYRGDYDFDDYLRTGLYPDQPASPAEGEDAEAWGCTTFAALNADGERLLGRNFDWYADHPALLLFTDPPNGYASVAMVDISYLGYTGDSIGLFNRAALAHAPYLPFDGMNEMGVAVGMMAVPSGNGQRDPTLRTLEDLEVIRLVLDYAASLDQALELLEDYNVRFNPEVPLHYLIADASGASAVVEYMGGELRVMRTDQPWHVATNFIISEEEPHGAASSCWRYNKAYQTLEDAQGSLSSPQALLLLEGVAQNGSFPTIWSVLYNLTTGEVSLVMDRNYAQVFTFHLKRTPTP